MKNGRPTDWTDRGYLSEQSHALVGKVALVTGAATGIGKAIARALAAAGARVIVNHPHTDDTAASVVADIDAAGGSASAIAADVSRRSEP